MTEDRKTNVVLGVTGSIAAYKAVELMRMMQKKNWDVTVVMTESAKRFVGELTFRTLSRNPVYSGMFDDNIEWVPDHISLSDRADLFVIAPCTANVIAKTANGLADDLLSASVLATKAPVLIAPAMNENMLDNPATAANIDTLKSRGIRVMETGKGDLACGVEGRGRMPDLEDIVFAAEGMLD